MTDKQELKACPFCGSGAFVNQAGSPRKSMIIMCDECGASMESGDVVDRTQPHDYAWNRRTPDPELAKVTAERDEARDLADRLKLEAQSYAQNIDVMQRGLQDRDDLRVELAFTRLRLRSAESLLASRTTAIEAAIDAMGAANRLLMALRLGKSIHNERTPTRPVGGPLWDEIPDVVSTGEARIAQLRSLIAGKETDVV